MKHGDGQLPHHAFISYTPHTKCTKADRAMTFVTLIHLAVYFKNFLNV
jgi:hypothetical protein